MQDIIQLKNNEEINNFQANSAESTIFNIDTKCDKEIYLKTNLYMLHNELSEFKNIFSYLYKIFTRKNYRNIYSYSQEIVIGKSLDNLTQKTTFNNLYIYSKNYDKTLNIITRKESLEKLEGIKNLGYDWDGYGAEPMNPEIYNNASKLIEKVIIPPRVFPTANGTIQFEYHKKNNDDEYLEFEILNNNIEVLFMRSDDDYKEYTYNINDIDKINDLIKEFYGIS